MGFPKDSAFSQVPALPRDPVVEPAKPVRIPVKVPSEAWHADLRRIISRLDGMDRAHYSSTYKSELKDLAEELEGIADDIYSHFKG